MIHCTARQLDGPVQVLRQYQAHGENMKTPHAISTAPHALGCSPVIAETASKILDRLSMGPATVRDLVRHTGVSRPTMARSLRWLRDAGVQVTCSRTAGVYRLASNPPALRWYTLEDAVKAGAMTRAAATAVALACKRGAQ